MRGLPRLPRLMSLPKTLRWRLFLILFAGLAAAHVLSFCVVFLERYLSATAVMLTVLEKDVGTSIALLNRLPAQERPQWLPTLQRPHYSFELGPGLSGVPELSPRGVEIANTINEAAGQHFPVTVEGIPGQVQRLQAHITLHDGSLVTIDVRPAMAPLATWLPYVLAIQLCVLILCTWFAVRLAIRPLFSFANAAATLDPGRKATRLDETGPTEVAYAASAFNAMRDRITHYLEERVQILAAISHDLQTPITRMKLRAEIADDSPEKDKLMSDLDEIEKLVCEGVAYAHSARSDAEMPARVDIRSFVESIVFDYQDIGNPVSSGDIGDAIVITRPLALRRILSNLIDNALKFAGDTQVTVVTCGADTVRIAVRDHGPGIPEDQLEAVLQPFYRVDQSRNRATGGTGLGLAIAQQLVAATGGTLTLRNHARGGLEAEIILGCVH